MKSLKQLKKWNLTIALAAAVIASESARADHQGDPIGNIQERLVSRDLGGQSMTAGSVLSLPQILNLGPGTQVNAIVVIASIQPEPGKREGSLNLIVDGRPLPAEYAGPRMEAIHIWLDRPVLLMGSSRLEIAFNQNATVALLGATVQGQGPVIVPPPPARPACEVLGYGTYQNNSWKYRVRIDGALVNGTDSLSTLYSTLKQLQSTGLCVLPERVCQLSGAGAWAGNTWAYRISASSNNTFQENILHGTDSFDSMVNTTLEFKQQGICQPIPQFQCKLSSGAFNGNTWQHLITIGNAAVYGSDSMDYTLSTISRLRSVGYCQ